MLRTFEHFAFVGSLTQVIPVGAAGECQDTEGEWQ